MILDGLVATPRCEPNCRHSIFNQPLLIEFLTESPSARVLTFNTLPRGSAKRSISAASERMFLAVNSFPRYRLPLRLRAFRLLLFLVTSEHRNKPMPMPV